MQKLSVCKGGWWFGCLAAIVAAGCAHAPPPPATTQPALSTRILPPIRVSEDGRYFVKADGTPFFWQADTAWAIFNHASPADVDAYMDDRAAKGFNVIQGVIALWDYNTHPNSDGQLPFVNRDLGKINLAYFKNVDRVLDQAAQHGLYMAVLPYWHKNAGTRLSVGDTPLKMEEYCKFLGQRYAKRNLFWVLGGDSTAAGPGGPGIQHVTDLEAQGLIEGAKLAGVDKIMISYHPTGRQSSSFWFHDRPWLDFNSIQSGHFIDTTNFQIVAGDYAKTPVKPTLDMEPGYENITDRLLATPNARRIQAVDVRRSEYLDVFAGAAGLTYGQGEVYGFAPGGRVTTRWGTAMSWKEALQLPGSGQMQFIRHLIESRPALERMPDQSLIVGENSPRAVQHIAGMRGASGDYAFVYLPAGIHAVTVKTALVSGPSFKVWWYDPRTGMAQAAGVFDNTDTHEFTAPTAGPEDDWVLVIDDATKNFPPPGMN